MALTTQQVLAASDAWVWVPPQARAEVVAGVPVVDYPAWAHTPFWAAPLDTGWPPERAGDLVEEVVATARARDKPSMTWWLSPSARPAALADALLADFSLVGDAVWGHVPADEERRAAQLTDLARPLAEQDSRRVVGYLAGEPVAAGGLQVVDGVARLWGAATLESARGRGAYRAVLRRRLVEARTMGATTALVHARVGTSGPILRRCGFGAYGVAHAFRLDLRPARRQPTRKTVARS